MTWVLDVICDRQARSVSGGMLSVLLLKENPVG